MNHTKDRSFIIGHDDLILVTGAAGFIGSAVVENLLDHGFRNLRCVARRRNASASFEAARARYQGARIEVVEGNLLSPEHCWSATKDAAVILHLAAGRGEKLVADAFLNSVVTTRNLLETCLQHRCIRRFVNVSSFTVYSNSRKPRWRVLDESCPVEARPERRGEAYTFAKVKQDELVVEYGKKYGLPYVILRPGYVYGPGGGAGITGRVGTGAFGLYLHLGGSNPIPLSYVDNCAGAIVLAGLTPGVDGEVFNIVDDDLCSSRTFLRLYKRNVRRFRSVYIPKGISYLLCYLWERYSAWSEGQLPPAFNRNFWHANWKKTRYSNEKLKARVGWSPRVSTMDALMRHFEACRMRGNNA